MSKTAYLYIQKGKGKSDADNKMFTRHVWFVTASCHDDERDRRPEAEVEMEAGTLDYHELESDVASQHGCYSPVSSVSDMEPSADHGKVCIPPEQFPRSILVTRMLATATFSLSVCRVVLQIPRARHARLVVDMLATRQTILTCRDGLKVASIVEASS